MNKYKWLGFISIFILLVIVAFVMKDKSSPGQFVNQVDLPVPTPLPSPTPVIPKTTKTNIQTIPLIFGEVRGQIVCDYQTPPVPGQFGTAKIESNWNNAKVSVCVSANGGSQTLIATDNRSSGARTDNAPWISLNVEYIFTLFNQLSSDQVCSGPVLSSCRINARGPQIASPRP